METISSRQNPIVETARRLARRKDRHDPHILLDGAHLVREALDAGLVLDVAAVTSDFLLTLEGEQLSARLGATAVRLVQASDAVMSALSPVATPSGIVAIGLRPSTGLDDLLSSRLPLILVAIDVQDPGNVGALVRAAEAGGATGVLACGSTADPFAWKALRGSMGSAFRMPLASAIDTADVLQQLRAQGITIIAAASDEGRDMYAADLSRPIALLLGREGGGLPLDVLSAADERITIPMRPPVESLNVAVAGALLVYEAARQRSRILTSTTWTP